MAKRKLKIAYIDLCNGTLYEDYSISPRRYGGGATFARWAKELWNNNEKEFCIFAPNKCFENLLNNENKDVCIDLPIEACKLLYNKVNIKNVIPYIDYFDIILHGHTNIPINNFDCKCVQVHWAGFGRATDGHPYIPYTFVFNENEKPVFPNQKLHFIKIGKPVSKDFIFTKKHDFIFLCYAHRGSFDSILTAKECIKNNIRCYFGGPIASEYPLLDYIDNKNTFYIGEIGEEIKLEFSKRARMASFLFPKGATFNLSVIECLAMGTPILCYNSQWFDKLIIDNVNGFYYNGNNFLECWEKSKDIDQKNCWLTAKEYSVEEMMRTFGEAIDFVVKDANIKLEW